MGALLILMVRWIIAGIFLRAGVVKLGDRAGFRAAVANYQLLPPTLVAPIAAVLPARAHTVVAHSRDEGQLWRYTFARPAEGWFKPGFNDASWKAGPGGFGTVGTPGAVVRTVWNTNAIWLRRRRRSPTSQV